MQKERVRIMKKILPKRQDLLMFIIGFLPAFIALLDYVSFKFGLFLFAEPVYFFDRFCFPIIVLLIAVLTSAYRSTLFCSACAYVSWAGVYLLVNRLPNAYDVDMFGWDHVIDHARDFLMMTLVAVAASGVISLIIWLVRKIRMNKQPDTATDFKMPAVNIVLIVLCAGDLVLFVASWITWHGVHTNDSIPSLLILAVAVLAALILELLITLLPKDFAFARKLAIVFNAVFLSLFYFTAFIVSPLFAIAFLPIVHVAAAGIVLLVRKTTGKK